MKREMLNDGFYYPQDQAELSKNLKDILDEHSLPKISENEIYAIVSPVESYAVAAPVYAASYSQLSGEKYDSVIIISPLHKMSFRGMALTEHETFDSPLGEIAIDQEANEILNKFNEDFITYNDTHHNDEHAIELQIPFIQTMLGMDTKIIPIIIGETNTRFTIMLSRAISQLYEKTKKRYLIIVSTNLSYNLEYTRAVEKDTKLVEILNEKNADHFSEQLAMGEIIAYGGGGIITTMRLSEQYKNFRLKALKYYNSSVLTGDKHATTGYASIVFWNR